MINRTADQFEAKHDITVTPRARNVLISEAVPHQQAVERDIANGAITLEFLADCVAQQLETAVC